MSLCGGDFLFEILLLTKSICHLKWPYTTTAHIQLLFQLKSTTLLNYSYSIISNYLSVPSGFGQMATIPSVQKL